MAYRVFLFLLFANISVCMPSYGQNEIRVRVVGDSIDKKDVLFVGEIHACKEQDSFRSAIVNLAIKTYDIKNVVLEVGVSSAFLINRFIKNNDSSIFFYKIDPIFLKDLLKWKKANEALSANDKITVYGVDFERMYFVKALQLILKENKLSENTKLYNYIFSLPDSICTFDDLTIAHKKLRTRVYGEAKRIFQNEDLKSIVKVDYDVLEKIMKNPATEKHFSRRNRAMYLNIKNQIGRERFICVVGEDHTFYHNHEVNHSLLNLYANNSANKGRITLIMEIGENVSGYKDTYHKQGDQQNTLHRYLGPKSIIDNDSLLSFCYDRYYNPSEFPVVSEHSLGDIFYSTNHGVSTYFVFLR